MGRALQAADGARGGAVGVGCPRLGRARELVRADHHDAVVRHTALLVEAHDHDAPGVGEPVASAHAVAHDLVERLGGTDQDLDTVTDEGASEADRLVRIRERIGLGGSDLALDDRVRDGIRALTTGRRMVNAVGLEPLPVEQTDEARCQRVELLPVLRVVRLLSGLIQLTDHDVRGHSHVGSSSCGVAASLTFSFIQYFSITVNPHR